MVYFLSHKSEEVYSYIYRALDGDVDKIRPIDVTRDVGVRIRPNYSYYGRPIEVAHVPTKIELSGPKRPILDIYDAFGLAVSVKIKDVIENFEPNVHQFFPIEFVWEDGSHAAHRFWFVPCNRLDTVDRAKTTFEFRNLWFLDGSKKELVFNRSQIGGHHVWIDKFIVMPNPGISEALKAAFDAAGITGAHYQHFPETD
ncbi:hypothetical protein LJR098_001654 [Rhizobium sp. LjRoot98]|uniref:imm11 family protein n=1 Tax=unclassified Rhizobium TaxID=2613769 RepID=UPI0007149B23|nr:MULTISPECIES: DUF1629 domain-containing protein [unclassified Rhizobium]KQV39239.1 hypothetical protein ASC96_23435 [Rhizobium sp. Root1204]KQY18308.1 hypothetical protein ASD36_06985 [Rhizobium sp. Root1334]KRB98607.1 hypothetical protein ASE23_16545 [Rhizobium sp. Root73]